MRCAVGLLLLVAIGGPSVTAYEPGDMVVGIREAEIKVDQNVVGYSVPGWCTRVLKDKGDRLWIAAATPGWLNAADVLPLGEGVAYFNKALVDDPKNADLFCARGNIWTAKHEYEKAFEDYRRAIKLAPEDPNVYRYRAISALAKGDCEMAIQDHTETIRLQPESMNYNNRGYAYLIAGKYDKALNDFQIVLQNDPKSLMTMANIAYLRACCPDEHFRDGEAALTLAKKACAADKFLDPLNLHVLACAYAESSDFAKAARWERKASELNPAYNDAARKVFEAALKNFERQQPFHEIIHLCD